MKDQSNFSMQTSVGLVVTLLGIGFVLDTIGIFDFSKLISVWWPSIIVIFTILSLVLTRENRINSVIILVIAILFQLQTLGYLSFNLWSLIWPVIIIVTGINLILSQRRKITNFTEKVVEEFALLGGSEKKIVVEGFEGGNITAIMGGVKLDFRKSTFAKDARLNVVAIMGGVEIIVPRDCKVVTKGSAILGGFTNNAEVDVKNTKNILTITGTAAMGGVDIKN